MITINFLTISKENTIHQIEQIDESGYLIMIQGKYFSIGYWGSIKIANWKVGDYIIINKSEHSKDKDYQLFNLRDKKDA